MTGPAARPPDEPEPEEPELPEPPDEDPERWTEPSFAPREVPDWRPADEPATEPGLPEEERLPEAA